MDNRYSVISLKQYLEAKGNVLVPNDEIQKDFSFFSCGPNEDVKNFLQNSSIPFTQKKQSITYCVYDDLKNLVGYFALAVKPVSFRSEILSNTSRKIIERVSKYDVDSGVFNASGFLIAQLGKNFRITEENRISGNHLLNLAINTIQLAQNIVGGTIVFLECENKRKLLRFYESNGFRQFSSRIAGDCLSEKIELMQMYRLI